MTYRVLNNTTNIDTEIKTALLRGDPVRFAHLVKFQRPIISTFDGGHSYAYINDGPFDIVFDDGSLNSLREPNGPQTYRANLLKKVGDIRETIEAQASTTNIVLSSTALGASITDTITIEDGVIESTYNLVDIGFKEGNRILLTSTDSSATNINQYYIISSFFNNNKSMRFEVPFGSQFQDEENIEYTISLAMPEISSFVDSKDATNFTSYINRDVFIYRVLINPDTGEQIGEPFPIFRGIIANGKLNEDPFRESTMTWSLTSHWGDFVQVAGRKSTSSNQRNINAQGSRSSLKKDEYSNDLGFIHADKTVNILAPYITKEERFQINKKKKWTGSKQKVSTYTVNVEKTFKLDLNLDSAYIPVVYGVQRVKVNDVFADLLKQGSTHDNLIRVATICEGQISGILNIVYDNDSLVCFSEQDYSDRQASGACTNRADQGDTLLATNILAAGVRDGTTATTTATVSNSITVPLDSVSGISLGDRIDYEGLNDTVIVVAIGASDVTLGQPVSIPNNFDVTFKERIGAYPATDTAANNGPASGTFYQINNTVGVSNISFGNIYFGDNCGIFYSPKNTGYVLHTGRSDQDADVVLKALATSAPGSDTVELSMSAADIFKFKEGSVYRVASGSLYGNNFVTFRVLKIDDSSNIVTVQDGTRAIRESKIYYVGRIFQRNRYRYYAAKQFTDSEGNSESLTFQEHVSQEEEGSDLRTVKYGFQNPFSITVTDVAVVPSGNAAFIVQDNYYQNSRVPYWGKDHRLLDTAYLVSYVYTTSGNISDTENPDVIVKGKFINCYNYDNSYRVTVEGDIADFVVGDAVYIVSGSDLSEQTNIVAVTEYTAGSEEFILTANSPSPNLTNVYITNKSTNIRSEVSYSFPYNICDMWVSSDGQILYTVDRNEGMVTSTNAGRLRIWDLSQGVNILTSNAKNLPMTIIRQLGGSDPYLGQVDAWLTGKPNKEITIEPTGVWGDGTNLYVYYPATVARAQEQNPNGAPWVAQETYATQSLQNSFIVSFSLSDLDAAPEGEISTSDVLPVDVISSSWYSHIPTFATALGGKDGELYFFNEKENSYTNGAYNSRGVALDSSNDILWSVDYLKMEQANPSFYQSLDGTLPFYEVGKENASSEYFSGTGKILAYDSVTGDRDPTNDIDPSAWSILQDGSECVGTLAAISTSGGAISATITPSSGTPEIGDYLMFTSPTVDEQIRAESFQLTDYIAVQITDVSGNIITLDKKINCSASAPVKTGSLCRGYANRAWDIHYASDGYLYVLNKRDETYFHETLTLDPIGYLSDVVYRYDVANKQWSSVVYSLHGNFTSGNSINTNLDTHGEITSGVYVDSGVLYTLTARSDRPLIHSGAGITLENMDHPPDFILSHIEEYATSDGDYLVNGTAPVNNAYAVNETHGSWESYSGSPPLDIVNLGWLGLAEEPNSGAVNRISVLGQGTPAVQTIGEVNQNITTSITTVDISEYDPALGAGDQRYFPGTTISTMEVGPWALLGPSENGTYYFDATTETGTINIGDYAYYFPDSEDTSFNFTVWNAFGTVTNRYTIFYAGQNWEVVYIDALNDGPGSNRIQGGETLHFSPTRHLGTIDSFPSSTTMDISVDTGTGVIPGNVVIRWPQTLSTGTKVFLTGVDGAFESNYANGSWTWGYGSAANDTTYDFTLDILSGHSDSNPNVDSQVGFCIEADTTDYVYVNEGHTTFAHSAGITTVPARFAKYNHSTGNPETTSGATYNTFDSWYRLGDCSWRGTSANVNNPSGPDTDRLIIPSYVESIGDTFRLTGDSNTYEIIADTAYTVAPLFTWTGNNIGSGMMTSATITEANATTDIKVSVVAGSAPSVGDYFSSTDVIAAGTKGQTDIRGSTYYYPLRIEAASLDTGIIWDITLSEPVYGDNLDNVAWTDQAYYHGVSPALTTGGTITVNFEPSDQINIYTISTSTWAETDRWCMSGDDRFTYSGITIEDRGTNFDNTLILAGGNAIHGYNTDNTNDRRRDVSSDAEQTEATINKISQETNIDGDVNYRVSFLSPIPDDGQTTFSVALASDSNTSFTAATGNVYPVSTATYQLQGLGPYVSFALNEDSLQMRLRGVDIPWNNTFMPRYFGSEAAAFLGVDFYAPFTDDPLFDQYFMHAIPADLVFSSALGGSEDLWNSLVQLKTETDVPIEERRMKYYHANSSLNVPTLYPILLSGPSELTEELWLSGEVFCYRKTLTETLTSSATNAGAASDTYLDVTQASITNSGVRRGSIVAGGITTDNNSIGGARVENVIPDSASSSDFRIHFGGTDSLTGVVSTGTSITVETDYIIVVGSIPSGLGQENNLTVRGMRLEAPDVIQVDPEYTPSLGSNQEITFRRSDFSTTESLVLAYEPSESLALLKDYNLNIAAGTKYRLAESLDRDFRVSTNPAMQLLDYLVNDIYGKALDINDEIDLDSFKETALLCDAESNVTLCMKVSIPEGTQDIPTVGEKFECYFNNPSTTDTSSTARIFGGTVAAVNTYEIEGESFYEVVFNNVFGKLGKKFNDWQSMKHKHIYYNKALWYGTDDDDGDPTAPMTASEFGANTGTGTPVQYNGVTMICTEANGGNYAVDDTFVVDIAREGDLVSVVTGATTSGSPSEAQIEVDDGSLAEIGDFFYHDDSSNIELCQVVDASGNFLTIESLAGTAITFTASEDIYLTHNTFVSNRITNDGNPIVKSFSPITQLFTGQGYSLYDCDFCTYWKYLGWDNLEQYNVTRHQTNQVIATGDTVFSNVNLMLQQFNGLLRYASGKYYLDVKTTQAPIDNIYDGSTGVTHNPAHIDETRIIGKIDIEDKGAKNSFNSIEAKIIDPLNNFGEREIIFFDSTYLKQDNNVPKQGSFAMPGVTNYFNARIGVKQELDSSRYSLDISFTMEPAGLLLLPGQIIDISYNRFNWSYKPFRIKFMTLKSDGLISVVATEHSDDFYLLEYDGTTSVESTKIVESKEEQVIF